LAKFYSWEPSAPSNINDGTDNWYIAPDVEVLVSGIAIRPLALSRSSIGSFTVVVLQASIKLGRIPAKNKVFMIYSFGSWAVFF
jgi:hypothetical protein